MNATSLPNALVEDGEHSEAEVCANTCQNAAALQLFPHVVEHDVERHVIIYLTLDTPVECAGSHNAPPPQWRYWSA